jgi:hypothetical protein
MFARTSSDRYAARFVTCLSCEGGVRRRGLPQATPREPTEDWPQLRPALVWPEQDAYELIRPIVLFGRSPAERAQQTGVSERTIYRKTARFDTLGIVGLIAAEPQDDRGWQLPLPARRYARRGEEPNRAICQHVDGALASHL